MPEPLSPALDRVRTLLLDDERLVRAVAAGHRRAARPAWRRVELRPVRLRAGRRLQVTRYDEVAAHTANHPSGPAAAGVVDSLLAEPFGTWHVRTTEQILQLRVTKRGEAQVHVDPLPGGVLAAAPAATPSRRPVSPDAARPRPPRPVPGPVVATAASDPTGHDRVPERLLAPTDPFLHAVGVTTADGVVKSSGQAKYRQVEEFLRELAAGLAAARAAGALPGPAAGGPLRVVDLGCGNAYLTFAAFAYLTGPAGCDVRLTGVDVRPAARERNTALAARLGWSDRLSFVAAPIATVDVDPPPQVVLALHACDTATDDALARAIDWHAGLILAAPCCHHDVQAQLAGRQPPAPYALLTRHGILRERLADVLTDGLRAAILRLHGYRADVVEFVDSRHTPRNALIRAVRTAAAPSPELRQDYAALVAAWGVTPALERRLASRVRAAADAPGAEATG